MQILSCYAMQVTYLDVPFPEKDAAKALGARWDGQARKWFVPPNQPMEPFAHWLPAAFQVNKDRAVVAPTTSAEQPRGVPLSRLLAGVAAAVANAYSAGVWTTAEVLKATLAKNGHVWLELSERNADGRVLAKASASIWANTAQRILPEFERATGAKLGEGIKVMVRARPVFKAEYGFSLEIDAIDPNYTLGDLEARKRNIRERLKREQLFDRNKRLDPPWDFVKVLVVSPPGAAGLGDFAAEANRLAKYDVCQFHYVHSPFQGEGAPAAIREALVGALAKFPAGSLDAVIIIRGGGAVNDLAWLNDYDLARFICECPVPVLTGIGHERDDTVLDEVANTRFDTPSKVAAGIEQHILRRTRDAKASFESIIRVASRQAEQSTLRVERLDREVKTQIASSVSRTRADIAGVMANLRLASIQTVHRASRLVGDQFVEVRTGTMQSLMEARRTVPAAMSLVQTGVFSTINSFRLRLDSALPATLDRVKLELRRSRSDIEAGMQGAVEQSWRVIHLSNAGSTALLHTVNAGAVAAVRTAGAQLQAVAPAMLDRARVDLRRARSDLATSFSGVVEQSWKTLGVAEANSQAMLHSVQSGAAGAIRTGNAQLRSMIPATLERAKLDWRSARSKLDDSIQGITDKAQQSTRVAASNSEALFREIAGQGPKRTLVRGFAMVRNGEGKTLTSAQAAVESRDIEVQFSDGRIAATVTNQLIEVDDIKI
ncbi:exodeoxyribonuclease VII large subunit [Cupriavidus sp. DF5525]|uniref:exodeoxyribonuclease VII large subunit n=1 Tax=Cupriavidus sp. DF5525 TaxID=3160989 RepID=UPI0032DF85B4